MDAMQCSAKKTSFFPIFFANPVAAKYERGPAEKSAVEQFIVDPAQAASGQSTIQSV